MDDSLSAKVLIILCSACVFFSKHHLAQAIDVRLVGGSDSAEGRVEVYYTEWGTVCDDSWSTEESDVICRQLGYAGSSNTYTGGHFGEGSGPIWLDDVDCVGDENDIDACSHSGWGSHNCHHYEDVGVRCYTGSTNAIRLVGGSSYLEGRVEIYYSGAWGTVCDDSWDLQDAEVVCRQLGFSGAENYYTSAHFGQGSGTIWLDEVACTGAETSLSLCNHNGWSNHNCGHSEDAGVSCYDGDSIVSGSLRLVSGSNSNEGRLEVYYSNQWGTVCDDNWGDTESDVACRQLGYAATEGYYGQAHFGQGSGQIWLDNVDCIGSETQLQYCSHNNWGSHDCSHSEDVGLRCSTRELVNGDMRLQDGDSLRRGRVEVYNNGEWGTVCDDGWDESDAEVVCRALGFGGVADYSVNDVPSGSGTIGLDQVGCYGGESSLLYCLHNGWNNHDCSHSEDVAIECSASGLSAGAIAGIVIGSLVGLILLLCCCCKEQQKNQQNSTTAMTSAPPPPPTVGNRNAAFTISDAVGFSSNPQSLRPNPPQTDIPAEAPPTYDSIDKYSTYIVPREDGTYPVGMQPPPLPPQGMQPPPPPPQGSMYPPPSYPPTATQTIPLPYMYPPPPPQANGGLPPVSQYPTVSSPYPTASNTNFSSPPPVDS